MRGSCFKQVGSETLQHRSQLVERITSIRFILELDVFFYSVRVAKVNVLRSFVSHRYEFLAGSKKAGELQTSISILECESTDGCASSSPAGIRKLAGRDCPFSHNQLMAHNVISYLDGEGRIEHSTPFRNAY